MLLCAAAVVLLALGAGGGEMISQRLASPPPASEPRSASSPGEVDIGFSQDMTTHHQQGIVMAQITEDSNSPEVSSLADVIEANQLEEAGRMQGWLTLWEAPTLPTGTPMTWMGGEAGQGSGHDHGGAHSDDASHGTMPGMATQDELTRLRESSGEERDVLFLQLMLRHHQAGMQMASYAAEHAEMPQVRNLAERITFDQRLEIQRIIQLLDERGAERLPPPQ